MATRITNRLVVQELVRLQHAEPERLTDDNILSAYDMLVMREEMEGNRKPKHVGFWSRGTSYSLSEQRLTAIHAAFTKHIEALPRIMQMWACGCSCGGRDPWHRSSYRRAVEVEHADAKEGWVQLPFSTQPVRVVRVSEDSSLWEIDRSSIVYDK